MHQKMATLGIWRKCMLTKLRGILRGRAPTQGAMRDFLDAAKRLRPGDIAIDCGANVGRFTRPIAEGGATVHAFEPNPDAFAELSRNLRSEERRVGKECVRRVELVCRSEIKKKKQHN